MKLVLSLSVLLVTTPGCSILRHKIDPPDVELMVELPFLDGKEGLAASTKTPGWRTIQPEQWAELHPYTIHLAPSEWTKIKTFILTTCRKFQANCTETVASIDKLLLELDSILRKMKEGK